MKTVGWQVTSGIFCSADPDGELDLAIDAFGLPAEQSRDVRFEFPVQGISLVRVSAECRVAIHTWPEHALATVDVYSQTPIQLAEVLAGVGWRAVQCRADLPFYDRLIDGSRKRVELTDILVSSTTERHILVADTPTLGRVLLLDHQLSLASSEQDPFFATLASLVQSTARSVVLNSAVLLPLVPLLHGSGVTEITIIDSNAELCFVMRNWFADWLSDDWAALITWSAQALEESEALLSADAVICIDPCWTNIAEHPQVSAHQQLICSLGLSTPGTAPAESEMVTRLRCGNPAGQTVPIERTDLGGRVIVFSSVAPQKPLR